MSDDTREKCVDLSQFLSRLQAALNSCKQKSLTAESALSLWQEEGAEEARFPISALQELDHAHQMLDDLHKVLSRAIDIAASDDCPSGFDFQPAVGVVTLASSAMALGVKMYPDLQTESQSPNLKTQTQSIEFF